MSENTILKSDGGDVKQIYKFLATGFYSGYLPAAPGTYGTVAAILLYLLVHGLPIFSYVVFCVAFVFLSVWIIQKSLSDFIGDDPQVIVIDEFAGFLIAMIGHPFGLLNIGLGFVLFRFFDILKPPPIRNLERKIKGPWGIVLDDVLAGIFACVVIWLIRWTVL